MYRQRKMEQIDSICVLMTTGLRGLGKRKREHQDDCQEDDIIGLMTLAQRLSIIRMRRKLFKKQKFLDA